MALYELRNDPSLEVTGLLTTISEAYRRISHHGVREELLEIQAVAIGLPLHKVYLPSAASGPCANGPYEELMERVLTKFRERGISAVAHGDIFLEDLRAYRERNLGRVGLRGLFPIWRRDTVSLVQEFARLGFRAVLTCVEGKLGKSFAGLPVDAQLLEDLPDWADPCGENGEYHSFVYDGPIFRRPVEVRVGEIVERDGRFYADLLPAGDPRRSGVGPDDIPPI